MVGDPIIVHAPMGGWGERAARKRKPYLALCGEYAHLPPTSRIRKDEDGYYLLAGPHERYYTYCPKCAEQASALGVGELKPVG